jgi:radical SAM protein with 4Fe4S-binding SPASM domain|tara:strand:+ start:24854 stop:26173 length:1320 start_codon:yes stop_codon:yes gene_type:complete
MSIVKELIESGASEKEIIAKTESYCPLLWSHLHVSASGDVLPCCIGQWKLPIGNINRQSFDEIWHGDTFKKLRKAMFNDQKVPHCSTCYRKEKSSGFSLRHDAINKFHDGSRDMVLHTQEDGTAKYATPIYLDIRFSNICNMACRMCGHFSSSKWFADAKKLAEENEIYDYTAGPDKHTAIIHGVEDSMSLLNRLDEYLPYVQEIYFAGGEPLFMEEHYTLLNRMIELGLTDTHIRYSTNLSIMKYKRTRVVDIWKNFENVFCAGSIDTYGARAENIRSETKWDVIEANMAMLHKEVPHVKIGIAPTMQIMNAYTVCELQQDWIERGYVDKNNIFWNILQMPQFYNLQIMPKHMKEEVKQIWLDHLDWLGQTDSGAVHDTIKTTIAWMEDGEEDAKLLTKLCQQSKQLDQLRGEDTRSTFPELNYIWEKYWNDNTDDSP